MSRTSDTTPALNQPRIEDHDGQLPSALTFFMPRAQRNMVLRALRVLAPDRTQALLLAVGVSAAESSADQEVRS